MNRLWYFSFALLFLGGSMMYFSANFEWWDTSFLFSEWSYEGIREPLWIEIDSSNVFIVQDNWVDWECDDWDFVLWNWTKVKHCMNNIISENSWKSFTYLTPNLNQRLYFGDIFKWVPQLIDSSGNIFLQAMLIDSNWIPQQIITINYDNIWADFAYQVVTQQWLKKIYNSFVEKNEIESVGIGLSQDWDIIFSLWHSFRTIDQSVDHELIIWIGIEWSGNWFTNLSFSSL